MLVSTALEDFDISVSFIIFAKILLLGQAAVTVYDTFRLMIITSSSLEASSSQLSVTNDNQAMKSESPIQPRVLTKASRLKW